MKRLKRSLGKISYAVAGALLMILGFTACGTSKKYNEAKPPQKKVPKDPPMQMMYGTPYRTFELQNTADTLTPTTKPDSTLLK
ncbi:hypothetical protein [Porphyromonas pogonae]|uniref:hypothetical protein n=1 Tax=Porphyromonas pogonae TaxID=867595 RepID=UPI002E75BED8|nr:hypothetical protein [Porphyromonas pogonae]